MQEHPTPEELGRQHSERFRTIGGMPYPRAVAEAYDRDLARAAAESDKQVAATVAAWERCLRLRLREGGEP